jgi:energy-converting hydrogenase B subunit D
MVVGPTQRRGPVIVLQAIALLLLAASALGVVLSREPLGQALAAGFYGIVLALLFFFYQAPDVALAQIAVAAVGVPLMIVLALGKMRSGE